MRGGKYDLATPLLLAALLLLVAGGGALATPAMQRVVTETLILVTAVVGLYVFVGNSGITSFGHIAFMALAAYVSALLTLPPAKKAVLLDLPDWLEAVQLPVPLAALIGAAIAGLVALVAGGPIMRLRGIAPSMAAFALLVIVHTVVQNWKSVTGGRQALVGLPLETGIWTAFMVAVLAIAAAAWYQQSRRGALLRCSRENEVAAESIGIDITHERLVAFVISAVLCGLAGSEFAHYLGTVTANTFYLGKTFITLAMLVVGGMRSLSGAVAGVLVLSAVSEFFRSLEQGIDLFGTQIAARPGLEEVALALIMLVILLYRRDGLFGDTEIGPLLRRARRGSMSAPSK
jgi:branched-chain amino acid transport system permease protein